MDPKRLLASDATEFERNLLDAVLRERPSPELQEGMRRALGLPETAVEAFMAASSGAAVIPPRSEIHRKDPAGAALVMPGLVDGVALGVKLIASAASAPAASEGARHTTCFMLLWDPATLAPLGLISAELLNEHRTGAGFAAATRALARPDSAVHAVYGAGKLAKPVVLVTPFAVGIKDELTIVTTSAAGKPRSYKVRLVSDPNKWTQLATFRYQAGQ